MKLLVNGEEYELAGEEATVQALLDSMRYSFPMVVVKVNDALVPRETYAETAIEDGDLVDAYHLVSGG